MRQTFTIFKIRYANLLFTLGVLLLSVLPAVLSAQVTVTITKTDVKCFGGSTGTATATGAGGASFTYAWSNGATTAAISNLATGVYTVTATSGGNSGTASVTIQQPPVLGVSAFGRSQICDVVPDGIATATPFGGTTPYTYLWNTGSPASQITGLNTGTYTVTVTDLNGCTAVDTANVVFFNEGLWVTPMGINATCFGQNNASATVMIMSGTAPFQYTWNTGATTQTISNLPPGTYTVSVTDANGCKQSTVTAVTQPTVLTVTTSSTAANCGLQGSATVSGSGGNGTYTASWSTGSSSFTISAMPGTYGVTLTDAKGCTGTASATVNSGSSTLNVAVSLVTQAGCTTGGSATATASGGSGTYTYVWDNNQTTQTANNLSAGNRSVTVTDMATGCTGVGTVNVTSNTNIAASAVVNTNATCTVGGSATVTATGGTAPYTYLWSNGSTTVSASNLTAGAQRVTVRDAAGCTAVANVQIPQSQGPNVTAVANSSAACTGAGGSATATATGGLAPYVYLWSNGNTNANATNLPTGTAGVTVTDANGCASSASVTITQAGAPTAGASITGAASCTTGASATASGTGGTGAYTFSWSNGATTAAVTGLAAGTYTVTVRDVAGCTSTASISIVAPQPPIVVISASSNAKCDQPGSAAASASGGSGPYTYSWSNGETTAVATNLPAGSHTVTVRGSNGCSATATVNIGFASNGVRVGDYVWYDGDQEGDQDPIETNGVPNVTVMLIKAGPDGNFGTADDITVSTTTTNSNGKYIFECVTPGSYIVMFSNIPAGYEFTKYKSVPNGCKDSDVKPNGKTEPFTITAGQADNLCIDAGIHTICDNIVNAGEICCNQTICEGQTAATLYPFAPPSGGTGAIQYLWLQLVQVGPSPPQWVGIAGATNETYSPGRLFETSYFMRCARRAGCETFKETNIVTITVIPAGGPGCENFIQNMVVTANGPHQVQVAWSTKPEGDDYLYYVQRSSDQQAWTTIATVDGKGDATADNQYSALDKQPLKGMNFYRIKRVNQHGIEAFSFVKEYEMNLAEGVGISIYPNPVISDLTVQIAGKLEHEATIEIINLNGKVVKTHVIPQGATSANPVTLTNLDSGVYVARIRYSNGDVSTVKLTKL
jgi:hypothetical protein